MPKQNPCCGRADALARRFLGPIPAGRRATPIRISLDRSQKPQPRSQEPAATCVRPDRPEPAANTRAVCRRGAPSRNGALSRAHAASQALSSKKRGMHMYIMTHRALAPRLVAFRHWKAMCSPCEGPQHRSPLKLRQASATRGGRCDPCASSSLDCRRRLLQTSHPSNQDCPDRPCFRNFGRFPEALQLALLENYPDYVVGRKIGRSPKAARIIWNRLGIPHPSDGSRKKGFHQTVVR